jgi:SAM-dependent methyltransferase
MEDQQENVYHAYHNWRSWSEDSFGIASPELEAVYRSLIRRYSRATQGYAIDFGFGNGEMLAILRSCGFRAIGIERNQHLCKIALQKGFEVFESLEEEFVPAKGTSALITAFHVLEHLDKKTLQQTLVRFGELLCSGGIVLAAFPNGDSPFSVSSFNGDITHNTWIGSSMAEQLGSISGLKLDAFHSFPALTTYSLSPFTRLRGLMRISAEKIISKIISAVYYGSQQKMLSPVAVAVWVKS